MSGQAQPQWCLVDRNGTQYRLPQTMIFLGREECDIVLKVRITPTKFSLDFLGNPSTQYRLPQTMILLDLEKCKIVLKVRIT